MVDSLDQDPSKGQILTFLDDLASSAPTPGGGAAAALVGAMAAGLVSMVGNLTIGRPRYAAVEAAMRIIVGRAELLRGTLTRLADDDAHAYARVAVAYKLPKTTESDRLSRIGAIQDALRLASVPPLAVMEACREILPLSLQVAAHGNATVVSDAGVAAELAAAGVRASVVNVRVNLTDLRDADYVRQANGRIAAAEEELANELSRVSAIVRAKLAPRATG